MSEQNEILTAAHEYRKRGWRVIQLHGVGGTMKMCGCERGANCTSPGKHPVNRKWQDTEPYSAADIEDLWAKRKNANVGLATGAPSGFWVLDIDPKSGGMESMAALVAERGALPETFVVQTGSGGYHYYFALPDFEVRNDQSGRVGKGIDVRGSGGQVVAAPSITDRGAYTVARDATPVQAPQWLLDKVRKDEVDSTIVTAENLPKPEEMTQAEWERLTAYAKRAIDSELERLDKLAVTGWQGEPWNGTTFEVACSLIEFANSPWNAYSLGHAQRDVMKHAPRDKDGFDDNEVAKTFASAVQKVGDKARQVPEDRRAEPDPLFEGVRVNPTEGGGTEATPVAKKRVRTSRFFGGEKGTTPLYAEMARGVVELGPLGWGRDLDFWSYADGVWKPDHYVVQHRLVDMLGNAYRTAHRSNVRDVAQRHAQQISGDPLEPMMNFRNGMLDWREATLLDHDPSLGSTVQLRTDWDPEATCPKFDGFLADVMHEDYVTLAWEMIGYLMLSGNPRQVAFLLYGSGGNGKGTLLRVISDLLGHANIANESLDDLNGNRFRSASLFGKIANIAGDIDATYQEHTAVFKKLTGEDDITAEHKNMPPFKFRNWAVPVFSANKFPGSADVTEGYLRRWIVLNFHKRIPENKIIDGFSDQLATELPGIAAHGVQALRVLMDRGHFNPQGEALKAKEEFAQAIDKVRQWAASGVAILSPETITPLELLYSSYALWTERAGSRKVSEQEFSHRLESIGYPATRENAQACHVGLMVAPTARAPHNVWVED